MPDIAIPRGVLAVMHAHFSSPSAPLSVRVTGDGVGILTGSSGARTAWAAFRADVPASAWGTLSRADVAAAIKAAPRREKAAAVTIPVTVGQGDPPATMRHIPRTDAPWCGMPALSSADTAAFAALADAVSESRCGARAPIMLSPGITKEAPVAVAFPGTMADGIVGAFGATVPMRSDPYISRPDWL